MMTVAPQQVADEVAYRAGFAAALDEQPLDEAQPMEWIEGYVDALDLVELGPGLFMRMDAEC